MRKKPYPVKPCGVCNGTQMYSIPLKPCWQCDDGTVAVGWDEPENPDIHLIRALAKEVGYAIGTHGSQLRDYDIMAFPWIETAVSAEELVEHLCKGLVYNDKPAQVRGGWEDKPLGRRAVLIQLNGFYRIIDLSIAPIARK